MEKSLVQKLIDMIRHALGFRDSPCVICSQSRVSCEAILKEIYRKEIGDPPKKMMFDELGKTIQKQCPGVVPEKVFALMGTIQVFGNMASHPSEDLEEVGTEHAAMVETALTGVCNWFFNEYLQLGIDRSDFSGGKEAADKGSRQNYEDLIRSVLSDHRLELDEYEKLLETRGAMDLSEEEALKIERIAAKEILGKSISSLKDVLEPMDLTALQDGKPEAKFSSRVSSALEKRRNLGGQNTFNQLLDFYTGFLGGETTFTGDPLFNLIGCWQGWYSQDEAKTYFDLILLLRSADKLQGATIEPVNPNWRTDRVGNRNWLYAKVEGDYVDEYLVQISKTYLFKNAWSIDYSGVCLDGGTYFEGEWAVANQEGPFNAIKTKSLMPVRIFDTRRKVPIVHAQYPVTLNFPKGLWVLCLSGREQLVGLLCLYQLGENVYANLILDRNEEMYLSYMEGKWDARSAFELEEIECIMGSSIGMKMKLTVDYSSSTLAGTGSFEGQRLLAVKGDMV